MIEKDLPENIRESKILSADHIALLACVAEIPLIDLLFDDNRLKNIFQYYSINPDDMERELHYYAKELLDAGKIDAAWQVLLALN